MILVFLSSPLLLPFCMHTVRIARMMRYLDMIDKLLPFLEVIMIQKSRNIKRGRKRSMFFVAMQFYGQLLNLIVYFSNGYKYNPSMRTICSNDKLCG